MGKERPRIAELPYLRNWKHSAEVQFEIHEHEMESIQRQLVDADAKNERIEAEATEYHSDLLKKNKEIEHLKSQIESVAEGARVAGKEFSERVQIMKNDLKDRNEEIERLKAQVGSDQQ